MVFSSIAFIFYFLPLTLLLYFIAEKIGKIKIKNAVVLTASMVFYAWGGLHNLLLLVFLVITNFFCGLGINKYRHKKCILSIGIIVNLLVLIFYKYLGFITQNLTIFINALIKTPISWSAPDLSLPLGISFFTFQVISYLVDVYKKETEAQNNICKFALYVMMFPKLAQGPIVRYGTLKEELNERKMTLPLTEKGIKRFIIGLAKKVLLATTLGTVVDSIFTLNGEVGCSYAWLGAICYTLQIYYDFSGYTDMAIGLGWIFGFHISENFDYPYISKSIREFWRRWHISLSSWFRDYVYIPLGGNRKGQLRTYLNLLIVFLLTGIWHGAAWQFIVWGLYHGFFMLIERAGFLKILQKMPLIVQNLYAVLVVTIGWVIFRADNLTLGMRYIKNMFTLHPSGLAELTVRQNMSGLFWTTFVVALIFAVPVFRKIQDRYNNTVTTILVDIGYLLLFAASLIYLSGLSYNPFIYFKF